MAGREVVDAELDAGSRSGSSGSSRARSVDRTSSRHRVGEQDRLGLLRTQAHVHARAAARDRRPARRPRSADARPTMLRSSVVLPAPLRPINATISPPPIRRSMPRSAGTPSCSAERPRDRDPRLAGGGRIRDDPHRERPRERPRASRTVRGTGSQPTRRPSRATGGPIAEPPDHLGRVAHHGPSRGRTRAPRRRIPPRAPAGARPPGP